MRSQYYRLEEIAGLVQGQYIGQADLRLQGLASLEFAQAHQLAFVNGDKYLAQARSSQAGALIVTASLQAELDNHHNFIVVDNPYLAFASLTHVVERKHTQRGIESSAHNHP